jgi:protein-disulfide isomerase
LTNQLFPIVSAALLLAAPAFCSPAAGGESSSDSVIAVVDNTKVTLAEFERKHPTALFQARNAFYEAEKKALDEYIEELLLERQAKKENISVDELINRHVLATIAKDPDDAALKVYFEGLDTAEPFETVRPKIAEHLRERRIARARAAYMQTLRGQIPVVLRIDAPRAVISLENTPVRGDLKAPVKLVEYADYECPYCQQIQPELQKLEAEYKGRLAFAFKDVPLPNHPHAQKAAEAAHCAGVQNKYWEFHDLLLQTKEVDLPQLRDGARKLGLNADAFNSCLDSGQQAALVKTQLDEATKLGLQGTPSFFLNGRFFSGSMSYEQLRDLVEAEIKVGSAPLSERGGR